ncbi:MAG TPA: Gmad2 immunoglobulin-like domain-containing protein [Candidatus Eisenbacteria bacterium]|nr:Gmad2 immunoglobulin-like domain-containing protein [Candidatus Eisenbacteria bacterium]
MPSPLSPPSRPTAASPGPAGQSAIRLPEKPREGSYYRSAALFAVGIMILAGLLFAIVREASIGRTPPPPAPVEDPLFDEVRHRQEFEDWVARWRAVEAYVSFNEFTLVSKGTLEPAGAPGAAMTPSGAELEPPMANRYVWSPDRTRFVDYLASFGEPDSTLKMYNRASEGKLETLAFCGTPCRFDDAFWLDDERVVALGKTEGLKADGTPLCLPTGAGDEKKCYDRLTFTVYDISKNEQIVYRSENHLFETDPYEALKQARWASGLSIEERAALGISEESELETITGEIIDITPEGRILTLGGSRVPRFLAVSERASIRDMDGKTIPFEALHRGFMVETNAVHQTDGTSLAASVRVTASPNITVEEPGEGDEVGARFSVRGFARTFESNVQLRLTNDRSGKVLAEKFTTAAAPDAGNYGAYAFDLRLSSGLRTGDALTLAVFDTSAKDGSTIDLVTLHLVYRP